MSKTTLIKIEDTGKPYYTLSVSDFILGRRYDNNADMIEVVIPDAERDNTCVMMISDINGKLIDHIIMDTNIKPIRDNVSQYESVRLSFYFMNFDNYIKNSQIKTFSFLEGQMPADFTPSTPIQNENVDYLIQYGFTNSQLNGNTLEFYNMNGELVKSFDFSPFMQEQSDLAQTDSSHETFVKNKSTKYLANEGSDGTDTYAEMGDVSSAVGDLKDDLLDGTVEVAVATNVSTKINGHNITDIFENDGTTAKSATKASQDGNGDVISDTYVPKTRTINSKALSADITLTPADIGAHPEITSSNKLSSDLVDDTNNTHKFVSSSEKETWNGKQDLIDSSHKLDADLVDDTSTTNKFVTTEDKSNWNNKVASVSIDGTIIAQDANHNVEIPTTEVQTISVDDTVTQNSTNLIESGAVYSGLSVKLDKQPDGSNDLISNNKITTRYLPDFLLGQVLYGGNVTTGAVATLTVNAKSKLGTASNTITLTNDTTAITGYEANDGIYYIATTDFAFAGLTILTGDWLISRGNAWDKIDNTDAVTGIKGNAENSYRVGNVEVDPDDLDDTNTTNKFVTANEKSTWSGKQDALPTTSTVGRVLKSTSTLGATEWGTLSASDVGALPSNTTYVSSVNGSSGAITNVETTTNKVTSITNLSTDTQYPSAKCVYDLLLANGVIRLTGTQAEPINVATDMSVGKLYLCIGYIQYAQSSSMNTSGNLIFKIKDGAIIVFDTYINPNNFGSWAISSGCSAYVYINSSTGYFSGVENPNVAIKKVNSGYSASVEDIYVPTSYGTSGYLLESKGFGNAPTFSVGTTTLNTKNIDATPIQNSTALVESGGVYSALLNKENSSNKVTSLSSSSTNTQYPSAKAVYDAIVSSGIIQLTGTSTNPINLATDLVVGQMYALNGYITLSSTLNYNAGTTNKYIFYKYSSTTIVGINAYATTTTIGATGGSVNNVSINSSTGYVTATSRYNSISALNGNSPTSAVNIYAPTSYGTSGYLLESKGSGNAPTFTIGKVTSVSNASTDAQVPTAKCLYDYGQEVSYLTTAPSSANTSGRLKIVVLTSEPATKYDGYIYFITEA